MSSSAPWKIHAGTRAVSHPASAMAHCMWPEIGTAAAISIVWPPPDSIDPNSTATDSSEMDACLVDLVPVDGELDEPVQFVPEVAPVGSRRRVLRHQHHEWTL